MKSESIKHFDPFGIEFCSIFLFKLQNVVHLFIIVKEQIFFPEISENDFYSDCFRLGKKTILQ